MNLDDNKKEELINAYRTTVFETDDVDIKKIDSLISDSDLKTMFQLNNTEMCKLVNEKPLDKDKIRKLLIANINFYKIAKKRGLVIRGSSFLMPIATAVDYNADKLYDELNVGSYNNQFRRR